MWLPSDVEAGKFEAYCQFCWAEDRRILLNASTHESHVYLRCGHNARHGASALGDALSVPKEAYDHARAHVYDRRIATGA